MFYYENYKKFRRNYVPGIKRVKFQSYYPLVSYDDLPVIELKTVPDNYIVFFNNIGKLVHVNNLNNQFKYSFKYCMNNLYFETSKITYFTHFYFKLYNSIKNPKLFTYR